LITGIGLLSRAVTVESCRALDFWAKFDGFHPGRFYNEPHACY
jgi:hypothetical protein